MDCETFENLMIDELYGELDELTSAASKRHVAGCVRCASLIGGLKATRRLAVLPTVEPPVDLESKIMAAALEAQKIVPFRTRLSRAVSRAGSWAMRPQNTMAATFLLMIGVSLVLLRTRTMSSSPSALQVSVTESGTPAAASAAPITAPTEAMDMQAAANAHGMLESERKAATPQAPSPIVAEKGAASESSLARGDNDGLLNDSNRYMQGSAGDPPGTGSGEIGGGARAMATATAPPPPAAAGGSASSGAFTDAMTAYRAKNYDEATRGFDALAGAGDNNAALWAARSVREQSGCVAAVNRFDQLSGRAFGTTPGYDATYESGECYKSMGAFDAARQRFSRLLTVPAYAQRAQNELAKMANPAAQAKPSRAATPLPAQQTNSSAY
ncbi:MAG: hypothetical protein ABI551_00240 [Polyangiaceae bacterium]